MTMSDEEEDVELFDSSWRRDLLRAEEAEIWKMGGCWLGKEERKSFPGRAMACVKAWWWDEGCGLRSREHAGLQDVISFIEGCFPYTKSFGESLKAIWRQWGSSSGGKAGLCVTWPGVHLGRVALEWAGKLDCGAPVVDAEVDLLEGIATIPFHRVELLWKDGRGGMAHSPEVHLLRNTSESSHDPGSPLWSSVLIRWDCSYRSLGWFQISSFLPLHQKRTWKSSMNLFSLYMFSGVCIWMLSTVTHTYNVKAGQGLGLDIYLDQWYSVLYRVPSGATQKGKEKLNWGVLDPLIFNHNSSHFICIGYWGSM